MAIPAARLAQTRACPSLPSALAFDAVCNSSRICVFQLFVFSIGEFYRELTRFAG